MTQSAQCGAGNPQAWRQWRRRLFFLLPVMVLLLRLPAGSAPAGSGNATVLKLELDAIVHPLTAEYIERGLQAAAAQQADAVLLRLNTPGGLDTAMRRIIEKILASPVPVLAWVGPGGSRAASAGFLILLSADVAAMAPGTNTGAAHPVLIGGQKMDEVLRQKVEQDAAAYIRSIAGKRGRNAELAEKGVLESKSFTETEALENRLIDVIAASPQELMNKMDGKTIQRFGGESVTLNLAGAQLVAYEPSARYRFLRRIIDPNIAFILLALGALGLYVEFSNPGLIVPGVAGGILLLLGMFALSLLPINWTGAFLIILAFAFFLLEAKLMSHGVLAAGGILSMILGALILVDSPIPEMRIKLVTALSVALPLSLITVFLLRLVFKAWKGKVATGEAGLLDDVGTAQTDLAPEGKIFIQGEIWKAVSSAPVPRGTRVRVQAIEGLLLRVEPDGNLPLVPAKETRPRI